MAFDYEISAAIFFMLQNEYDELIVDIPRGEDSLFYSGQNVVAVGEAKNVSVSRNHWTLRSLFHSGSKIGPVLQLWIRKKERAKSVIFSTVGTTCMLERNHLKPDPEELRAIVESTNEFDEVRNDDDYTFERVRDFLTETMFLEWPHSMVKSSIHKWCREHDLPFVQGGIERAIALFQDETYYRGKRIQRSEIIDALSSVIKPIVQPNREYYTSFVIKWASWNCFGQMAIQLENLLDLREREMRAPWRDSSKDVNDVVIGILKERIESLKDIQERCGNEEISDLINQLEKEPQRLFKENRKGEKLRKFIRKLRAHYRKLEHDPYYSRMGEML